MAPLLDACDSATANSRTLRDFTPTRLRDSTASNPMRKISAITSARRDASPRERKSAQSIEASGSLRQKYQWPAAASFTLESSPATQSVSNWFSSSTRTRLLSSETLTAGAGNRVADVMGGAS